MQVRSRAPQLMGIVSAYIASRAEKAPSSRLRLSTSNDDVRTVGPAISWIPHSMELASNKARRIYTIDQFRPALSRSLALDSVISAVPDLHPGRTQSTTFNSYPGDAEWPGSGHLRSCDIPLLKKT